MPEIVDYRTKEKKEKDEVLLVLKKKHEGKSKAQLTQADAIEWAKVKMAHELGLK